MGVTSLMEEMTSLGTTPPTVAFSNEKPSPRGPGSTRSLTCPYWPRPPVWREVALYDARALRRLEVKPGLTCLWQIKGRSDLSFEQQVELDIEYIDTVLPLEEVRILFQTHDRGSAGPRIE